jgi:hypothetical protein
MLKSPFPHTNWHSGLLFALRRHQSPLAQSLTMTTDQQNNIFNHLYIFAMNTQPMTEGADRTVTFSGTSITNTIDTTTTPKEKEAIRYSKGDIKETSRM